MKKFLLLLALLALAVPALATDYTITTNANQDGVLAKALARANKATCLYYGQAVGCTQAQARREFCRRAGFGGQPIYDANGVQTGTTPLTASCDGSLQVDIYADVATFLKREVVRLVREEYGPKNAQENAAEIQRLIDSGTQAQKDAFCAAIPLPAGCLDK